MRLAPEVRLRGRDAGGTALQVFESVDVLAELEHVAAVAADAG